MDLNKYLTKNSNTLMTLIDVLATSGQLEKHPQLAIFVQELQSNIQDNGLEAINQALTMKLYNELEKEEQAIINNALSLITEKASTQNSNAHDIKTQYINFSFANLQQISEPLINFLQDKFKDIKQGLINGTCKGNDFLGWINLPKENIDDIISYSKEIIKDTDAFVFIGIGGSYLGAKAVLSALLPEDFNKDAHMKGYPELYFAGHNLSTKYLTRLLSLLKNKRITLVPISKSGTTTEPAVAFRILKYELEKMGNPINVVAITDSKKGALKTLANKENWKTFDIADNIGGRFSVFSPVGLFPIAVSGLDIKKLLSGANSMAELLHKEENFKTNPAIAYALSRQAFSLYGKQTEILSSWNPSLNFIGEWWKQLFGESEGKDKKGMYVASTNFTTDLHSLGQLIQDGKRNFIETFLTIETEDHSLTIKKDTEDLDKLNYLEGKNPDYINKKAYEGTKAAHEAGLVPTSTISLKNLDEYSIGSVLYFWEFSCALSALLQGSNPFNQPGVEEYKTRMFSLLGKK